MPILKLPIQLANQIAAGEVVERPSSVVKELVENSLDAGASSIEIDIERGGHKRIRIRDDGTGIPKEELTLALSPHATSKIASLEDLEAIGSLGFRGEALASISAVSRLTLTTKPQAQSEAWSAYAQGREMGVEIEPAAHPDGTTIDVVDLFYNTPARRKFLRAEKTEFQHIEDTVKRIALSRPFITFVLKHNGKVVKRFLGNKKQALENRISQVCGKGFLDQAVYASVEYDGVTLNGWIGARSAMRSSTDMQFCFVNGRAMRDKLLLHAIRQAYETVYCDIEQPSYVLFLNLSPEEVDVNVHPAKHEVRFHNARQIHDLVCKCIQDALVEDEGATLPIQSPTASHDYIRPLEKTSPEPVGSVSDGQVKRELGSARSFSAGALSRQAAMGYQRLMTATPSTSLTYRAVDHHGLVFLGDEDIQWIGADRLVKKWLNSIDLAASVSQPLLMPVSLQQTEVNVCIETLENTAFVVAKQSGKLILKEVPSVFRALHWVKLFPLLCEKYIDSEQTLIDEMSSLLCEEEHGQTLAITWFMQLSRDEQDEIVKDLKVSKPLSALPEWFSS
ncbi:DNA mismatch repair endonuclease MutL [Alteromonas sediminis]|uniref:DNA mismatch repair protein MutL n=1 Tax=Alteromonas sediminis TaxID=2259342 RepID=A0A3N5XWM5_9ALTE|nr:DNA mismatch repair endonuclease MutL [Alteromonas sediminis]RPJ65257.1 DNA mismatch repair endonuclease MutL [Alteromonas sediminis]